MKNLLLLSALFFSFNAFAQEKIPAGQTENPVYSCDSAMVNNDKSISSFYGHANFKSNLLEIKNADKIVSNWETTEVLVTGKFEYLMNGEIQVKDGGEKKTLRYKIGESIAYIY
ncbi:hypothetical protein ACVWYG_000158 [Pedobacter sp. UYEF25]